MAFLVVSWSGEASYETPTIYGPYASLTDVVSAHGNERVDSRNNEDLHYSRVLAQHDDGGAWYEVDDSAVAFLEEAQNAS